MAVEDGGSLFLDICEVFEVLFPNVTNYYNNVNTKTLRKRTACLPIREQYYVNNKSEHVCKSTTLDFCVSYRQNK